MKILKNPTFDKSVDLKVGFFLFFRNINLRNSLSLSLRHKPVPVN